MHGTFRQFALAGENRGAWTDGYVLMLDYLHLFVAFDDRDMLLERWIKSLKNALSKKLRGRGMEAPHWQKGFFDHFLRSEESYQEKWHYVRENPVRAGLVQNCRYSISLMKCDRGQFANPPATCERAA
jgi:putative transposase